MAISEYNKFIVILNYAISLFFWGVSWLLPASILACISITVAGSALPYEFGEKTSCFYGLVQIKFQFTFQWHAYQWLSSWILNRWCLSLWKSILIQNQHFIGRFVININFGNMSFTFYIHWYFRWWIIIFHLRFIFFLLLFLLGCYKIVLIFTVLRMCKYFFRFAFIQYFNFILF